MSVCPGIDVYSCVFICLRVHMCVCVRDSTYSKTCGFAFRLCLLGQRSLLCRSKTSEPAHDALLSFIRRSQQIFICQNISETLFVIVFICACKMKVKPGMEKFIMLLKGGEIMTRITRERKKGGFIVMLREGGYDSVVFHWQISPERDGRSSQCNKGHQVWGRGDGKARKPHR